MTLEHTQRPHKVADLAAPAAADLQVLAIDLLVHVHRTRSSVGVVPGDDVSAAVANQVERFFDRTSRAGSFDGDVDTEAGREVARSARVAARRRAGDVDDDVCAHCGGKRQPIRRGAEGDHARRSRKLRQRNHAQSNRPGSLDQHRVAEHNAARSIACTAVIRPQPPLM